MKNLAANLAKSANYASSAFFSESGWKLYVLEQSIKATEGGTIFQASVRIPNWLCGISTICQ